MQSITVGFALFRIGWKAGICFIQEEMAMLFYLEVILLVTSEMRSEFSYRLLIISRKLGNKYKGMIITYVMVSGYPS